MVFTHSLGDKFRMISIVFGYYIAKMYCAGGGAVVTVYIVVCMDVWKIWARFSMSNYKYGCAILAKIIITGLKFVIFRLKNIDFGAKIDQNYKYGPINHSFRFIKMGHVLESSVAHSY